MLRAGFFGAGPVYVPWWIGYWDGQAWRILRYFPQGEVCGLGDNRADFVKFDLGILERESQIVFHQQL